MNYSWNKLKTYVMFLKSFKLFSMINKIYLQHISEDCLRLTVTVPRGYDSFTNSTNNRSKLPVMFWIHGGAYSKGSATSVLYKAEKLSLETNTIIVTVNYRLGEDTW